MYNDDETQMAMWLWAIHYNLTDALAIGVVAARFDYRWMLQLVAITLEWIEGELGADDDEIEELHGRWRATG